MSETLDEAKRHFTDLATIGLKARYGEAKGGAYAFLLFGGYGVPGLVADAELVAAASLDGNPQAVADRFTSDAAASLVTDVMGKILEKALVAAGIELSTFGSIAMSFFSVFLRPTSLGDGTLPPPIPPAPSLAPAPAPAPKPKTKDPDPIGPKEPKEPKEPTPPEPKEPSEPKELPPHPDVPFPKG